MRKLIKIILLEVGIRNLKIRLRDDNCCKSANSLKSIYSNLDTSLIKLFYSIFDYI